MMGPKRTTPMWPLLRGSTAIDCGKEMGEVAYVSRNHYRVSGKEKKHMLQMCQFLSLGAHMEYRQSQRALKRYQSSSTMPPIQSRHFIEVVYASPF